MDLAGKNSIQMLKHLAKVNRLIVDYIVIIFKRLVNNGLQGMG